MKIKLITASVLSALALSGCGSNSKFVKDIDENYDKIGQKIEKTTRNSIKVENTKKSLVKVKGSWIGGKTISLEESPDLPEVFSQKWNFSFPGRLNVATIAEKITKATGVPVRVSPDVFMSQSKFILGGASSSTVSPEGSQQSGTIDSANDMEVSYSGTLDGFLNNVAAKTNVEWEYKDGAIEIFRLVTKSFTIKAAPGDSEFTASVGKTGVTNGGAVSQGNNISAQSGQSSFSSDGQSRMSSKYSVWPALESGIKAMLSPVGKISLNESTGTVVVTDTKKIVERVEKFLERENSIMTRQVRLRVEFLSVSISNEHESGIDWNVVYRRLSDAAGNSTRLLTLGTPATLTSALSGTLGFTYSNADGDQFSGSSAVIKALSGYGKATIVTTTSAVTLNRQPVPVTLTDQVGYLAATTPGVASALGGQSIPGLTPGLVTTGYVLNMLPTVLDTGNIMLQFALDVSELKRINTVTSGVGPNQQSIQTPEVSATQLLQRASIKSGQTLVLAGFDRNDGSYDKRGLSEGTIDYSNTIKGDGLRTASVILITPVVEDGE